MSLKTPEISEKPYHPPSSFKFPTRKFGNLNRCAQSQWFTSYSWLHYDQQNDQVYCYFCVKSYKEKKQSNTKIEAAFISTGFSNWKKALERFKSHETSACHKESMLRVVKAPKSGDIGEILNVEHQIEKQQNRKNFLKVLSNVQFLAKQNIAFRKGNCESESNFMQLLKLRSEEDLELGKWIEKTRNKYVSPENQNEILKLMANQVLTKISESIHCADFFALMIDETPDLACKEQAVICFRYVTKDLEVHEDFYGLYQVDSTKSDEMVAMIRDVLLRLNLSLNKCRGQCYDGARNMSGNLNGVATQIQRDEKRALYIHCYGHVLNLGVSDTIKSVNLLRNCLDFAHEITKFIRGSPKRNAIFNRLKSEISDESIGIRVLCATRWTVRADSLDSILNNYLILIDTFEECLEEAQESKVRATIGGIIAGMNKFDSFIGFYMAKALLRKCDTLSKALQSPELSAAQGQNMAKATLADLKSMKSNGKFDELWETVTKKASDYDIGEPLLPRVRKKPKRFQTENDSSANPKSAKEHYKVIYETALDTLVKFLEERFCQEGFETYKHLESLILKAANGKGYFEDFQFVTDFYDGDFDRNSFESQLETFKEAITIENQTGKEITIEAIRTFFKENSEMCTLLSEVSKLLKLILVLPATNATSERSFSALKRVKSYLRTRMGQERMNNIMVLHVHKDLTEKINLVQVGNDFVSGHEYRLQRFGKFV